MSEDDDDKSFEPSQKRLEDARARGEIPKSTDLSAAAAYGGLILAMTLGGAMILQSFGRAGIVMLGQADRLAPLILTNARPPSLGLFAAYGLGALPLFLGPALAVLAVLIAQRAIHFAPEKLGFKLSRISPWAALKQKFGPEGLVDFAKNTLKMLVVAGILALQLMSYAPDVVASLGLEPAIVMDLLLKIFTNFMLLVLLIATVFGAVDYLWQRVLHLKRLRMSRKEMTDEMKDAEGDPHVKMQRRQKGQEIATNQMLAEVPKADVVIVNPTHYAVALKWSRAQGGAPVCVAKGVDDIAAKIREKAAAAGVPLHSDPPTARALFATVDLGQQIRPEHYRAVAAAIRFAERIRKRAKGMLT